MQALKGLHSQLRLFELAGRALCAACMPGTLQTIQTRILSAVPAVEPSEEQEDSYNRRMREMLEAGVAARWAERNEQRQDVGTVHGQASKHQISEGNGGAGRAGLSSPSESARPRRRLDLTGIPMFSLDAARKPRVKSGGEAEPGPGSKARSVDNSPLDWRQLLQLVRLHQTTVTGEQMLTDSFRRKHTYLRISLTERCNLRCRYCMPAEGIDLTPSQELLSSDEVLRLARIFASAGVNKIRLTGGEPTVRRDIIDMCNAMSSLPGVETVGMTTNGVALLRKLGPLKEAGLNALNISLDTLRSERFEAMTRRRGHANVMRSIEKAVELGYSPLKVNVVVMKGVNDDEIVDFVELTRTLPLNVRFIEYMPFDGNVWSDTKLVTYKEMKRIVVDHLRRVQPDGSDEVLERMADPKGEVAKNFRLPGFKGTVSFVTSMTSNFCGDCNRLRLLADGNLKVCLFGANEVSLRDAMREGASDEELKTIISAALDRKRAAHAGMFELARTKNRAMITIGG